jgi:hypothetical protein
VPEVPYPRTNVAEDFHESIARLKHKGGNRNHE